MVDLDEQADPKPCKKEPGYRGWVFLIFLLVVAAVLLLWTQSENMIPSVFTTQGRENGSAMQAVSSPDATIPPTNAPDNQTAAQLQDHLSAMETRLLAAVAAKPQQQDLQEKQDILALRKMMAFMLSFSALQQRADWGGAFEAELSQALRAAPDDTHVQGILESMKPMAAQGAPSLKSLMASFDNLSPDLRQALLQNNAHTWSDRVVAAVEGLVTVKRAQDSGTQNDQLDSIKQALADGRLDLAREHLKDLPPVLQQRLESWQAQFDQRYALDRQITALRAALIESLTAGPHDVSSEDIAP